MSWQRMIEKNFCNNLYGHLDNVMSEVWILAGQTEMLSALM